MPPLLILLLILLASALSLAATLYLTGVIKMNHAELAAKLHASAVRAEKAKDEIIAAVKKLQDAIEAADEVPQSVVDAANEVDTAVGELDDLNEDAPETPPAG